MGLTLEPLADNNDPWVIALERLEAKILNPDLSFHKFCMSAWGVAPRVFSLASENSADNMVYDPPLDKCPAVVLEVSNPGITEDRGAGAELWPFTIGVYYKAWARDGRKVPLLRGFKELIRTVFCGWRTGTMDPLSNIGTGGYTLLPTDLTPEISRPSGGMLVGKGAFALRFIFSERILG